MNTWKSAIVDALKRHQYDPHCADCAADNYPCATHRQACENCGGDADHPGERHVTKTDMRGNPLMTWWCRRCDPEQEMVDGVDYIDDKSDIR